MEMQRISGVVADDDDKVIGYRKGCFISRPVGAVLIILFIIITTAVGLIIFFTHPNKVNGCEVCSCEVSRGLAATLSPEAQWEQCQKLAEDRGECACPSSPTTAMPPTTPPAATTPPRAEGGLRLNRTLIPSHYNIELKPYFYEGDDFGFDGSVEIHLTCEEKTNVIVLHINFITIHEETVKIHDAMGNELKLASWEEDKSRHFLKLHMAEDLNVSSEYVVKMSYNGTLIHPDWRGFYRSSYVKDNQTKWLVTTQFQRTHARKAFPCFDEPSFKATYSVTMVRKANYSSIGNMELLNTEDRGGGWHADVYKKSIKMSTYLVAFVVSDFTYKENTTSRGTYMRIWARPDQIDLVDYALEVSGAIMEFFEDYLDSKYPLNKTDQIAIPDFAAGAMENWGLVTYRLGRLLYDPNYSTMAQKRGIAEVIAHEFAHSWFGNLVTCDWWDDTWLNEGFARFFQYEAIERVHPTWRELQYAVRTLQFIMGKDGTGASQPIFVEGIEHHDDLLKAFDTITYNKGGSVIRMMKFILTAETFRKGLGKYVDKFAYGTTVHNDLYAVLEQQAKDDGMVRWDDSVTNFTGIMDTWIEQMGYPVVKVTVDQNTNMHLKQEHFLFDENDTLSYQSPFGSYIWDVPVIYTTEADPSQESAVWLYREQEKTQVIPAKNSQDWLLANIYEQGFFRVNYDAAGWGSLFAQLNNNHTVFSIENRAQIVDDALSLAKAGIVDEVSGLSATEYMGEEDEWLVWYPATQALTYIDLMLRDTVTYGLYQKYMLARLAIQYGRVGWDDSNIDEHMEKYQREVVLRHACRHRHKPCLDKASELFAQWMLDPSNNPISPNLRRLVYCNAIRNGGATEWEFAFNKYTEYNEAYIASELTYLRDGLVCTREPWIIKKHLDYALSIVSTSSVQLLAQNPVGYQIVWDYFSDNWYNIPGRDNVHVNRGSVLTTLTEGFNTEYHLNKLHDFIAAHPTNGYNATYTSLIERTEKNIKWMQKNKTPIENYLNTKTGGASAQQSASYMRIKEERAPRGELYGIEEEGDQFDNDNIEVNLGLLEL
ncbi:unnamed protein product [Owenia fusiformis]|uniref:glutamyl aminopeptidase n=1 Tax=Owenia fusiformis TaxID=6347 RepID=A0A8J1TUU8_OWEFU|nr:unnamed protein product [Owenia fusiformis]